MKFDRWIQVLREDVIEGEFGYEPGEFTVYREGWRPNVQEGPYAAAGVATRA